MSDMIDAMVKARDALTEYYKDDAPVVALLDHAIVDAEGYDRAYELLFKEHGKMRALVELIFASTLPYNNGEPTFSDKVTDMWRELTPNVLAQGALGGIAAEGSPGATGSAALTTKGV